MSAKSKKLDVEILKKIAEAMRGCTHTSYRPAGQQKIYHAIESLDMRNAGSVIEQAVAFGIKGSKIEDSGLAAYVYWEDLPWQ